MAVGWETKCARLEQERDTLLARIEAAEELVRELQRNLSSGMWRVLREENEALSAKVDAMEKQEPVATVRINAINGNPSVDFVPGHRYLHHNDKLYLTHGAQPAPTALAGARKVTRDFRWDAATQCHVPTLKVEFDPVHIDAPTDAKGWQDQDRIAAMLEAAPEAKP